MEWTEERVALLTKLWADGLSASQIAKQLGGITRNAALGKLHRMGLTGTRAKPSAPAKLARPPRPAPLRPRLVVPVEILPPLREVEAGPGKPWTERVFGECAYPLRGDGADVISCCATVKAKTPYCPAHYHLMFKPALKKRRDLERLDPERPRRRWAA